MLREDQRHAIERLSVATSYPTDNALTALLIRAFPPGEDREQVKRILAAKRTAFQLDDAARSQRRWQRETRRPSRARHHDSIEIREKYVRGHLTTYNQRG